MMTTLIFSIIETFRSFACEFPGRTAVWALLSPLILALLGAFRLQGTIRQALSKDGDQPETLRREYRCQACVTQEGPLPSSL